MAEAFAIASGLVTVVDTSGRLVALAGQCLRTWKNAPAELFALHNEIEDLRIILNEARRARDGVAELAVKDSDFGDCLSRQIAHADAIMTELHNGFEALNSRPGNIRLAWVRRKSRAERHRHELRGIRDRIQELLVAHNLLSTSKVGLQLVEINASLAERHTQMSEKVDTISSQLEIVLAALSRLDVESEGSAMLRPKAKDFLPVKAAAGQLRIPKDKPTFGASSTVSFSTVRSAICWAWCPCQCHSRLGNQMRFKSPEFVRDILGSLFIGYAGCPGPDASCNHRGCRETRKTQFKATYVFPAWFVLSSIRIVFEKYAGYFPEASIIMRNRSSHSDDKAIIFRAARDGDVALAKKMIERTPACLNTVEDITGATPLHIAVSFSRFGVVRLLLSAGMSLDVEDDLGTTPRRRALTSALSYSRDLHSGIYGLIGVWEYSFEVYFPPITRSILGLPPSPYNTAEDERSSHTDKWPNVFDDFGYTPLHWAAFRSDKDAVIRLLEMGADPTIQCKFGQLYSPFYCVPFGTRGDDDGAIIDLMCKAGATFSPTLTNYRIAHLAAAMGRVELLQALVANNVDVMEPTEQYLWTPLLIASQENHVECVQFLLELGADLEVADHDGDTALLAAVYGHAHETVKILLEEGASHLARRNDGSTILHKVSHQGDSQMLDLLSEHGLPGVDIYVKDSSGQTARDVFLQRLDLTPKLQDAFNRLESTVRISSDFQSMGFGKVNLEREDDLFHDAEEYSPWQ